MLILFDLDDTLIPTTDYLVPKILDHVLQDNSIHTPNSQQLSDLRRLMQMAPSSMVAIEEYCFIHQVDPKFIQSLKDFLSSPNLIRFSSHFSKVVNRVLSRLAQDNLLCIVTAGEQNFQLEKLRVSGIISSYFTEVVVCPVDEYGKTNKGPHYWNLCQKYDFEPDQVICCGDRILNDLRPAKRLGMTTVHLKQGRGLYSFDMLKEVDYTIVELTELIPIVESIKKEQKNYEYVD